MKWEFQKWPTASLFEGETPFGGFFYTLSLLLRKCLNTKKEER